MTSNRTTALAEDLRAHIVDGRIGPGEKLPSESNLIAEHRVSRTVVREAIARLQAEGLVHTRRGAGSYALVPPARDTDGGSTRPARTLADRRHLLAFRAAVESEAAALAADGRAQTHLARMDAALAAFDDAGRHPAATMGADYEFHRAIAEASGNPWLVDAVAGLGPAMIAMPAHRLDVAGPAQDEADGLDAEAGREVDGDRQARVAAEHRGIRDAIADGDARAAAAAMRAHLAASRRRLDASTGGVPRR